MPAFNSEKFISEAIESVTNQTYENWELIIVNDGSTDGTFKNILNFTDSRITYFNIENKGVCYARNYGFTKARKDSGFIYFMDSDDVLLPTFIEECLMEMLKNNAKVVFCDYLEINQNGEKILENHKFKNYFLSKKGVEEITEHSKVITLETLFCNSVICESTTIFSYECFNSSSKWDENLSFAEGMNLFFELNLNHIFLFLNKQLYYYRKHGNQSTRIIDEQKRKNDIKKVFLNLNKNTKKSVRLISKVIIAKAFALMVKEKELKDYLNYNRVNLKFHSRLKLKIILLKYKLIGPSFIWYLFKKIIF